jgi:hypothetical protein
LLKEAMAWSWLSTKDGLPQLKTFDTAEDAIADMRCRLGTDYTLLELYEYGFKLTYVKITITPILVLDVIKDK